jgi:hypothetical protein
MTEVDFYKFIQTNGIEYHWYEKECLIFIDASDLDEFCKLLGDGIFEDDGIETHLKYRYICIDANDICDHFGFDINKIFPKDENNI